MRPSAPARSIRISKRYGRSTTMRASSCATIANRSTGISRPHSWEERTASFQKHALDLLEEVTLKAVEAAGVELGAIDILVTNTITGLAIPSLDAKLFNRLKFKPTIERLPIFGLGCGGGVAGLARATRLAHATEGAHVLFLTVDLCSLCLRVNDPSAAMFVSGALFGDGAAGVLLRNTKDGAGGGTAHSCRWRMVLARDRTHHGVGHQG